MKKGNFLFNLLALSSLFFVFVFFINDFVGFWGRKAVNDIGLTGLSAWLLSNINLFIVFGFFIGVIFLFFKSE